MSAHLPIIAGPTASGKTHFAMRLAERHGLEIVSADSRQIYRRLDIGTAKPTRDEMARVPHHVIDVCDATEVYDLSRFTVDAEAAIADIRTRGKRPLVVGGTGLYIRGLSLGIFEDSSSDSDVRDEIKAQIAERGAPALHAELTGIDPEAAAAIHPNDAVRIVRALEVFRVTGDTITALRKQSRQGGPRHERRMAVVDPGREILNERINQRTGAMFEGGLIAEIESLIADGLSEDAPGLRAIGYPQALAAMRGEMTVDEAIDEVAKRTRQYAKRQRTWFRAENDADWFDVSGDDEEKILANLEKTLAITDTQSSE